jgi:hypothetical protein
VTPPGRHPVQLLLRRDAQRVGEQIVRDAVMLAAEQQPVDVALAELDLPAPAAPGLTAPSITASGPTTPGITAPSITTPGITASRLNLCLHLCLSRHDVPKFLPQ